MHDKTQALEMIHTSFPNAVIDEQFEERLEYKIPQSDIKSLADCFAMLEKGELSLLAYIFFVEKLDYIPTNNMILWIFIPGL